MFNPLDNDDMYIIDRKANIKKGFFSMIDNVLGGGQSSTTQMANNMSLIQSNLSNVSMVSNQQYS